MAFLESNWLWKKWRNLRRRDVVWSHVFGGRLECRMDWTWGCGTEQEDIGWNMVETRWNHLGVVFFATSDTQLVWATSWHPFVTTFMYHRTTREAAMSIIQTGLWMNRDRCLLSWPICFWKAVVPAGKSVPNREYEAMGVARSAFKVPETRKSILEIHSKPLHLVGSRHEDG